jgi:hypothetical protein
MRSGVKQSLYLYLKYTNRQPARTRIDLAVLKIKALPIDPTPVYLFDCSHVNKTLVFIRLHEMMIPSPCT